ncbi:DNA replication/repair protein RecF [Polymorphobacter fuscus]|uniref:DNA replication and repair protein RecF n=1 Tax=Sandarakinorhabdus fusca TaxID=1439888 RepID=A0A7C9KYJ0_9SPHN|nr:DNA replication/repair protein RecF [Polymorphobacter fuscus]KAB7647751.1 DNA replication/repair protein RecF [Polymorphobacter fuscus]MQT17048.1 DNA replication/repair protein RecF [Polymorphobacter fuscus]NJC08960.1 DNA replication and repair protein RecF [Polymorphobacter fuscus]
MPAIVRLALTDFRSYAVAAVTAAPGAVVITGDNGAGKTNILDAISLLGPGRGLRGAALSDAARSSGPGGWSVAATLAADGGAVEIGTGTSAAAPERRIVRVNGAAATAATLGEWLALVWLTPAMDRIFADTPAARRRFLDRLVLALHPDHARQSVRYDAAMRDRTRLLTGEAPADTQWLAALEAAMAEHGAAIAAARADTVAALADAVAAAPDGPFARPLLALGGGETGPDFAAALARSRSADAAAGRALLGPHRADLLVTHAAKGEAAARGSTGEQKALLIAIILGHAELVAARTGRAPLLLLDEVAAHLDAGRRAVLFDRLAATGSQLWMTGTDPGLFAGVAGATWLRVVEGRVEG